jgi:hypothetical protein
VFDDHWHVGVDIFLCVSEIEISLASCCVGCTDVFINISQYACNLFN